jgi:hypothetical protein
MSASRLAFRLRAARSARIAERRKERMASHAIAGSRLR